MQVETIKMDPEIAKIHYKRYRDSVSAQREARKEELAKKAKKAGKELGQVRIAKSELEREDEKMAKAFLELSRGKTLINIREAIVDGGVNDIYLPRLAIGRADWKFVRMNSSSSSITFHDSEDSGWRAEEKSKLNVTIPRDGFPVETFDYFTRTKLGLERLPHYRALTPSIPPHIRPNALSRYYILWEAEWEKQVPVDPILLSRINDNLFVVVAQWDLTEVERGVLEKRLR